MPVFCVSVVACDILDEESSGENMPLLDTQAPNLTYELIRSVTGAETTIVGKLEVSDDSGIAPNLTFECEIGAIDLNGYIAPSVTSATTDQCRISATDSSNNTTTIALSVEVLPLYTGAVQVISPEFPIRIPSQISIEVEQAFIEEELSVFVNDIRVDGATIGQSVSFFIPQNESIDLRLAFEINGEFWFSVNLDAYDAGFSRSDAEVNLTEKFESFIEQIDTFENDLTGDNLAYVSDLADDLASALTEIENLTDEDIQAVISLIDFFEAGQSASFTDTGAQVSSKRISTDITLSGSDADVIEACETKLEEGEKQALELERANRGGVFARAVREISAARSRLYQRIAAFFQISKIQNSISTLSGEKLEECFVPIATNLQSAVDTGGEELTFENAGISSGEFLIETEYEMPASVSVRFSTYVNSIRGSIRAIRQQITDYLFGEPEFPEIMFEEDERYEDYTILSSDPEVRITTEATSNNRFSIRADILDGVSFERKFEIIGRSLLDSGRDFLKNAVVSRGPPIASDADFAIEVDEVLEASLPEASFATSYELASSTAFGITELVDDQSGVFRYTPNPGYQGQDAFQYSASNSAGESEPATVSISIERPVDEAAWYLGTFTFELLPRDDYKQNPLCPAFSGSPSELVIRTDSPVFDSNGVLSSVDAEVLGATGRWNFIAKEFRAIDFDSLGSLQFFLPDVPRLEGYRVRLDVSLINRLEEDDPDIPEPPGLYGFGRVTFEEPGCRDELALFSPTTPVLVE